MKVLSVVGARPQFVKCAPVSRDIDAVLSGADAVVVFAGHKEYLGLKPAAVKGLCGSPHPAIVDGCNVVDPDAWIVGGDKNRHAVRGRRTEPVSVYSVLVAEPFSPIGLNMFHVEQNISIQIVALLLRDDSHPRKLAKDLGVSHTTVLRKLNGLLDGNVVDFRTEGKNRVYFLKKTIEARVHAYVAEWYALGDLIEEAPHLRSVIRAVQEREEIPLAILFGSYAKGTADRKSDIDLYIETDDRTVKRDLEQAHVRLSVKVVPWDPENLLIQEIVKNHVILKGVERYYEKTAFFA